MQTRKSNVVTNAPSLSERRDNVRVPVDFPVSIVIAGAGGRGLRGKIINISHRGFSLETSAQLQTRLPVRLQFLWPPSRFCIAQGEIIRADRGRFAVSLSQQNEAFDQLTHVLSLSEPEEVQDMIRSMLSCVVEIKSA